MEYSAPMLVREIWENTLDERPSVLEPFDEISPLGFVQGWVSLDSRKIPDIYICNVPKRVSDTSWFT
jgi:hypothetical protein